ncbi:MAG: hypothetical protein QNJ77_05285 [Acidimicrobiia bacterium]|nr:hypothetical protein [Acidimicrobiia bacterium]
MPDRLLSCIGLLGLVGVIVAGCSSGDESAEAPPAEDVVLRIVVGDEIVRDWTLAELEQEVPTAEITVDGDIESGPSLLGVVAASGVDDWRSAEVLGMSEGRVVAVALEIDASEVDDTWVLDVTNRGTLKLAAIDLPRQQWVRDVAEIRFS